MAQSESNKEESKVPMPVRSFSVEFFVGVFALVTVACGAYLSVGLGDVALFGNDSYNLYAEFDNISGIKNGASVEISGVQVGNVTSIELKDSVARFTLSVDKSVKIRSDDIALIRTKGIIGDRYVKISRGSSEEILQPDKMIVETQSVVDIEDLIGKFVHNLDSGKSED